MDGEIVLNNDTSLVRVILEDEYGIQYMIFEAYPLIFENHSFSFSHHCDETCFLNEIMPYSLKIQIIDATLKLDLLFYLTDSQENPAEQRFEAKRSIDANKIEMMNRLIPDYNMNWVAGDNSIVAMYYDQKRNMFGDGYNLLGYEYYTGGCF